MGKIFNRVENIMMYTTTIIFIIINGKNCFLAICCENTIYSLRENRARE